MHIEEEVRRRLQDIRDKALANLRNNVLPFWTRATWDSEYGGFLTRFDRRGNPLEATEKLFIKQVRMLWSLAAAHAAGITDRGYLELAHKTFDYITRTMWDPREGGFYFSVTRDGRPLSRRKNTDVHGYGMIGIGEYFAVSRRPEALEWGERIFSVLMDRARDREYGFREEFGEGGWPVLNSEQMNLGDRQDIKTIDMHTNILEGLLYLGRASRDPRHLRELEAVFRLILSRGLHPEHRCGITAFDLDWNPVPDADGRWTTSYGLNAEMAWLLMEAAGLLGQAPDTWRPAVLGLVDHALEWGFDHERGGLAAFGPVRGHVLRAGELPARRLFKSWWAQAEMLNALGHAYELSGQRPYLEAFLLLFDWIWRHQIDHECGDWYPEVAWDTGRPLTLEKGPEWKTAFHASRALLLAGRFIQRVTGGGSASRA
jgi:mannobiose 2-epimerase